MDTRNKLEEARYFLQQLKQRKDEVQLSYFYFSAFLSAWRSVIDIMLNDFAKHYSLRITQASEFKIFYRDFWVSVYTMKHTQGLQFVDWWKKKAKKIRNHKLSKERNRIVHKEYPTYTLYVPHTLPSGVSFVFQEAEEVAGFSGALPITIVAPAGTVVDIEFVDFIDRCEKGFALIESIVKEAEEKFNVKL